MKSYHHICFSLFVLFFLLACQPSPSQKVSCYIEKDTDEANFERCSKQAELGNAEAQYQLSQLYFMGKAPPVVAESIGDIDRVLTMTIFELLSNAAEQGHPAAQNELGLLFLYGARGILPSEDLAVELFEKAARQENVKAQFNLGEIYFNGNQVKKKDYAKAAKWYEKSAVQGDTDSQIRLATILFEGKYRVKQDYSEAARWYKEAIQSGKPHQELDPSGIAHTNLAWMYLTGNGVNLNYQKAKNLYEIAVQHGNPYAQNNLGTMYETGLGLEKDYTKATQLFEKSAEQGYELAKTNLANLQAKLQLENKINGPDDWYEATALDWYALNKTFLSSSLEGSINECKKSDKPSDLILEYSDNSFVTLKSIDREVSYKDKVTEVTLVYDVMGLTNATRYFRYKFLCETYVKTSNDEVLREKQRRQEETNSLADKYR